VAIEPKIILNHSLVPKHEILTKKDTEEFLKNYNITREQLPKILESDPVVEAINAKRGNVLKITRESPTAGEAVYYRLVV
jgi:DNA-directed RNA polymerase subunit H